MQKLLIVLTFGVMAVALAASTATSRAKIPLPEDFLDRKIGETKPEKSPSAKWGLMEVGPFFSSGFDADYPAGKAISIKLGGTNQAVCFDTELLRMTMGWTGGFLKLPTARGGLEGMPEPVGKPIFVNRVMPGWAKNGGFEDPRPTFKRFDYGMNDNKYAAFPREIVYGHLPKAWGHWKGLYLYGDQVILNYTIGKKEVREMPGFEEVQGLPVFSRSFQISGPAQKMELLVCEAPISTKIKLDKNFLAGLDEKNGKFMAVGVAGLTGANFACKEGSLILQIPRQASPQAFVVMISSGALPELEKCKAAFSRCGQRLAAAGIPDVDHGGPLRWGEPLVTQGVRAPDDAAYVVDTLTLPVDNPWKSWIRAAGFDFFSDGRAALCSVSGDVWIVDGIDAGLEKLTWRRFATGLFQPLGLKIIQDKVYVTGRDQITRLHDLNHDGEADFYENFNNDAAITPHYHEFSLNLEADSKGNLYFCKGSNLREASTPHHGTLLKVSPDGKKMEVVCRGLRAPNGMGIGPNDEITVADNEGRWIPSSRVNLIKPGGFYGNVFTGFTPQPLTNSYDHPLFWIPHNNNIDNSSGGQVWVRSQRWGPFAGKMFHLSYGTCSLWEVMSEKVNGVRQAAVVKMPLKFETGIMRGRFSPFDGQMYLCGLSVWQSNAAKEGGLQRVRYTGQPVHLPVEFHVKAKAIEITFTAPLDAQSATDSENYNITQWNYQWTKEYGSKEYSPKNPEVAQCDPLEIKAVKLSADQKTVTLEVAEVETVMQMRIQYNLDAADGTVLKQEIFNSIFQVPGR